MVQKTDHNTLEASVSHRENSPVLCRTPPLVDHPINNASISFSHVKIENGKPFQTFRYLKQILGSHKIGESIMRHFWLQKLPSSSREVLASFKEDALTGELTDAVDRMFDANPTSKIDVTLPFTVPADSIS